MTSEEVLEQIASEISACTRCPLHHSRKHAVPGEGPANAEIMFIGEGPGFHENEQGRPFVGASGRLLEESLAKIGLGREGVFIGNVIKCRAPGNRDPQAGEIESCREYLDRQIRAINPKVIVTLGRFSMTRYFKNAKISAIHGQARMIDGRLVVAMYHPAAALRGQRVRAQFERDFMQLPELIGRAEQEQPPPEPPDEDPPKQLSLF